MAHTLIGASTVDITAKNPLTSERMNESNKMLVRHFCTQLLHHWFLQEYPNLDALPNFPNFATILPRIVYSANKLVELPHGKKVSDVFAEILDDKDMSMPSIFLAVVNALITNVADSFIAMIEDNRLYRTAQKRFTPESAFQKVYQDIIKRKLPITIGEAFKLFALQNTPLQEAVLLDLGQKMEEKVKSVAA